MFDSIEGDSLIIRAHHCSAEFLRKMSKLREEQLYIDVRIKVRDVGIDDDVEKRRDGKAVVSDAEKRRDDDDGDDVIKAHKLVLSCCSPYFEAMFSNKFADNGKIWIFLNDQKVKTFCIQRKREHRPYI
jgi:hypothetical protein